MGATKLVLISSSKWPGCLHMGGLKKTAINYVYGDDLYVVSVVAYLWLVSLAFIVRICFIIEFFAYGAFIVGVVPHKEVQVDHPAYAHEPGLQKDQQKNINA